MSVPLPPVPLPPIKEYDEWDNLKKVEYPDGVTEEYEYDLRFNLPRRVVDGRKIVTKMAYDDRGNLEQKIDAVGTDVERTTKYDHDDDGNLLEIRRLADVRTLEAVTTMTYDDNGNMTSLTDPELKTTHFTSHDAMGNVLEKTDARNKLWSYTYDGNGRLKTVTDPFLYVTRYDYDGVGNLEKTTDAELKETVYDYDNRNNLVLLTDANLNDTVFGHDRSGNLTGRTDAEGREMSYKYDDEGRMTTQTDGNGNDTTMKYDTSACPSCSGVASGKPDRIEYPFAKELKYDAHGRVLEESDISDETGILTAKHKYDETGNLVEKQDKENKITKYDYDKLNRLEVVTQIVGGVEQTTRYVYDNRDNLFSVTDARQKTSWFEYDRNNRLLKETRPMGEETNYGYDDAGNLIRKTDAKNQKTEYVYDDAGRMTDTLYFASAEDATPAKTVTFGYDKVGTLKSYDDGTTTGV